MLVGPSLGSAVAIDFSVNYPEAVRSEAILCSLYFYILQSSSADYTDLS